MGTKVFVGTASWTDPGFVADWYPKALPSSERLSWYASHFSMVELNSSFYAIPNRKMVARWCQQTPSGFVFDVKLHKLLSRHAAQPPSLPPDLRSKARVKAGRVALTPELERAVTERFLKEIAPLSEAKKLGALLLQLSPGFRPRINQLSELDHLLELLSGKRVAVELRNRDWTSGDYLPSTIEYFRGKAVSFVSVDAPDEPHFTIMPGLDVVTNPRLAYLRLHGRDAEAYIRGRTVGERFNYQYEEEELDEIASRAAKLAEEAAELHVVYNNNASDYAPTAAKRFMEILAERFPHLEIVTPADGAGH